MSKMIGVVTTSAAGRVKDASTAMHIIIGVIWMIPGSISSSAWLAISMKK